MSDRIIAIYALWREIVEALTSGRNHHLQAMECVLVECLGLSDDEFDQRFPNASASAYAGAR